MLGMTSREIRLARRPVGEPVPDDFELATVDVGDGDVVVRNTVMSVDPYMRGRMSDAKSYAEPFAVGEVMYGGAVGRVVSSSVDGFAEGDLVLHQKGWREVAVLSASEANRATLPAGVPESALLGALGMPGMTAWIGLTEIAPIKAGETVFVSAAAGAVGSVAGQIAAARGCRVIGSAGGARKVAYVRDELGFDGAFDYRDVRPADALRELAPDGIDVYFDNVGGEQLEAAIGALNTYGRMALCGSVSTYNATEPPPGPRNMSLLVGKRATLRGFIVLDHWGRIDEFRSEVGGLIAGGRFKRPETVVEGGIEAAPQAFIDMLRGTHLGKVSVAL
jgi:NADPH-dependent curcumin reductase CurA